MKSIAMLASTTGLVCALVATGAPAAWADGYLKGQYAVTESAQCLLAPGGFNPSLQPNNPSESTLASGTFAGVYTFDGRGGLTVDETLLNIGTPASAQNTTSVPLAEAQSGTGSGSYEFEADGSVTITVGLAVTILSGPAAGVSYSIDQLVLSGQLSLDNKTLLLSTTKPVVSTITFSNGSVDQLICNGSGTAVKVGP
jgi:hypothetical protein